MSGCVGEGWLANCIPQNTIFTTDIVMNENVEKTKVWRTLILITLHWIVIYDAYILPLPMIILMWKHWQHIFLYSASLVFLAPSLFRSRHPFLRDMFYFVGMCGFYFHWYLISSCRDIAYNTAPFTKWGLIGSLPFQICIFMQAVLIFIGCVNRLPRDSNRPLTKN
ncbi:MAG: hypothetical protein RLZZ350_363 [Verrucomicrobiota bacterium]|jgi:uncharacterized membrane protein (DUF106 family)